MYWSDTGKGLMLNAMDEAATGGADFGSLHTAYSTTGSSEVTGGSPAYARSALTWSAATGSPPSKSLAATLPSWNVPTATTVGWFGLWDEVTSGNFLGMQPIGGGTLQACSVEVTGDLTSDTVFAKAHGFTTDTRVVFWGTLPTGLSVGTIYYVGTAATDSFTLSTTAANANPVNITGTAPYNFQVQSCVPQTTVSQDVLSLSAGSINLNFVA